MSRSLERLWVSWLDSDLWRRFTRRGPATKLLHSPAFRKIDRMRRYATSYVQSQVNAQVFEHVRVFCMFIGHAKSGGTMIGSLLDAHPEVILADETDVLGFVSTGFKREQIFHLLLKSSRRDALKGRVTARRLEPYAFAVPGQWQSRYQTLRVIGHSRAGPSTGKLSRSDALLDELHEVMAEVETRVIHVIRNPFDPISLMMVRGERSFQNAIDHYFDYCRGLTALRERLGESNLIAVKYEDFVRHPRRHLAELCRFLGLEASQDYLDSCAKILYEEPERSRDIVQWEPQWIEMVENRSRQVDFLQGYTYTN